MGITPPEGVSIFTSAQAKETKALRSKQIKKQPKMGRKIFLSVTKNIIKPNSQFIHPSPEIIRALVQKYVQQVWRRLS